MSSDIIVPSGIYVTLVVEVKLALLWVWVSLTRATHCSAFDDNRTTSLWRIASIVKESPVPWRAWSNRIDCGLHIIVGLQKNHLHLTVNGGLVGNFSNALCQVSECLYTQIRQYPLIYWKSRCCHGKLWHLTTYITQAEPMEGGALETRLHLYWAKFPRAIEASHSLH